MKKLLNVAVNQTVVESRDIEVDLPEIPKFYFKNDDGNFFPNGFMLFAIIPRYETNPSSNYMLYEIQRGKQNSNDFVPTKDCRSKYWLEGGIRKTAFDILVNNSEYSEWKEITEDAFSTIREDLLSIENL